MTVLHVSIPSHDLHDGLANIRHNVVRQMAKVETPRAQERLLVWSSAVGGTAALLSIAGLALLH